MKEALAKLARLRRLEAIRAIAKRTAAQQAAQAEASLAQLQALGDRARLLAADYGGRAKPGFGVETGAGLRSLGRFTAAIQQLRAGTEADAAKARVLADARMAELANAERRRAAVDDRAKLQGRLIAAAGDVSSIAPRRSAGTELE